MSKQYGIYRHLTIFSLVVLLAACGGSDGSSEHSTNPNYVINATSSSPSTYFSFSVEESDSFIVFTGSTGQGVMYEPVPMYMFYSYIQHTNPLLKLPVTLNDTWSGPGKWRQSGWTHSSVVASLSESVVAGGSVYDNCAKITTTITGSGVNSVGDPVTEEENAFVRGSRDIWFAPGVGVVKMVYSHENGYVTTGELQSYSLAQASSSYFPLAIGSQWTYRWINGYRTSYVTETLSVDNVCEGQQGNCRL